MLKTGQTKIPIEYRTCNYCKHENGRITQTGKEGGTYCTLAHKNLNHWVTAQRNKSCCGWEPAEDGYNRLAKDRLTDRAVKINGEDKHKALCSFPKRDDSVAGRFHNQYFSWISFMNHRPCVAKEIVDAKNRTN